MWVPNQTHADKHSQICPIIATLIYPMANIIHAIKQQNQAGDGFKHTTTRRTMRERQNWMDVRSRTMTVSGEAYIIAPKMTQRMPTIMERFSWVCAARSTETTTMTMNTISTARTASALFCTRELRHTNQTRNQIDRIDRGRKA
jgi:hypothetical protein